MKQLILCAAMVFAAACGKSSGDQAREDMERSRRRTGSLDAAKPETKQFVNWLLEGTEQVTR